MSGEFPEQPGQDNEGATFSAADNDELYAEAQRAAAQAAAEQPVGPANQASATVETIYGETAAAR